MPVYMKVRLSRLMIKCKLCETGLLDVQLSISLLKPELVCIKLCQTLNFVAATTTTLPLG